MIDINEINEEIKKLENSDCTTYEICGRLAKLYIVRDHFKSSSDMKSATPSMMNSSINMQPIK